MGGIYLLNIILAQSNAAQPGYSAFASIIIPLGLMFLILYFLILRPQKREQQRHQNMLNNLKRGDKVITAGGIIGRIHSIGDRTVVLDLGNKVKVEFLKSTIREVINEEMELK